MTGEDIFTTGSIVAGLVAAGLWGYASVGTKKYLTKGAKVFSSAGNMMEIVQEAGRIDPIASANSSAFWNGWAAGAAALASLLQAGSQWLHLHPPS